jgi:leucyl aminopeptidase
MRVEATTDSPLHTGADTIVVGVFEGETIAHDVAGGALGALLESGEASAGFKRIAQTHAEGRRFVIAGLGPRAEFDGERARVAAAKAHARAAELSTDTLAWELPHHVADEVAAALVEGTALHAYRFDRYRPAPPGRRVQRLILSAHHDVGAAVRRAGVLVAAQNRARDLGNTPANELTPAALAEYARGLAGVRVTVLEEEEIRARGMGAFAAVAQGSRQSARLIQLAYDGTGDGAGDGAPRLGLIGKAVTFDAGGISLKPPASMWEMKFDMCGGAAVIEAIAALVELEAPVRVLGIVGATENLPDGGAVKPGDIVTALDGTTIEVNNTDAEGRLVLADCITHARREGCEQLVDLATLTAIDIALGSTYAAVMSNDDELTEALVASGGRTGELLWRMPLHPEFAAMVEGRYAQLTNRTERREAMPITGAEFLHHFAGATPWAHLDIAGTAYDVPRAYLTGKGATGFGVRLLVDLALELAAAA